MSQGTYLENERAALERLYRTGRVRFTEERAIEAASLPEGAGIGTVAALAAGVSGDLYVLDVRFHDIKQFDAAGNLIRVIGGEGAEPGRFSTPSDLVVAGDRLIVNDLGNRRLQVLTLDGAHLGDVPWPGPLEHPVKLRGLPGGRVVMETETLHLEELERPQDVVISLLGAETEIRRGTVLRNTYLRPEEGGLANVPQPFHSDIHWDASRDGKIAVGSSESYKIDIIDPERGATASITGCFEPVAVNDEDRKMWFSSLVRMGENGLENSVPSFIAEATKFPDHMPAFDEVLFDAGGNILVHPMTEAVRTGRPLLYDAFSPDGRSIGRFEITGVPPYFQPSAKLASDGGFWGFEVTDDGTFRIVKWRAE